MKSSSGRFPPTTGGGLEYEERDRRGAYGVTCVFAAALACLVLTACPSTPTAVEQRVERGRALYDTCAPCHGDDGEGKQDLGAPAIAGMSGWYVAAQLEKFKAGVRGSHPDDAPGARMRPMARSLERPGDVESIAEYVSRMKVTSPPITITGDAAKGKAAFRTCVACHGETGVSNAALKAPGLAGQSDWYLVRQLESYRAGRRGADAADIAGQQMRPMALTLPDAEAINDVVAFINSLR